MCIITANVRKRIFKNRYVDTKGILGIYFSLRSFNSAHAKVFTTFSRCTCGPHDTFTAHPSSFFFLPGHCLNYFRRSRHPAVYENHCFIESVDVPDVSILVLKCQSVFLCTYVYNNILYTSKYIRSRFDRHLPASMRAVYVEYVLPLKNGLPGDRPDKHKKK